MDLKRQQDLNEIKRLAIKRKTPTFYFLLFVGSLIVFSSVFITKYDKMFDFDEIQLKQYLTGMYIGVVVLVCLLFLTILVLMRPKSILEYDLQYIYYNKTSKKVEKIPFEDIKKVSIKVKSSKKAKKKYGTVIIRAKRRFKINNVRNIDFVENDIKHLVSRHQAFLKGIEIGRAQASAV